VLPANIDAALNNLKLEHSLFDTSLPQPQSPAYLKWVKKNLAHGSPIVTFVMCKGDEHNAYGPFDHIEPIFGLYSNHPLTDEEVYDDDYLVHGSDYAIDGDKNQGYFRKFSSMVDTVKMEGNCKNAQDNSGGHKRNEMYPCFNDQQNYGASIQGLADPKKVSLRSNLYVSIIAEPDVRIEEKPVEMDGWLVVNDLTPGQEYVVYRYNDHANYPTDSNFHESKFDSKHEFKAEKEMYKFKTDQIMSDSEAYFVAVPAAKKEIE